ncbi:MAG: D-sedoheptulose-7-phosphate isomerase [Candidatus Eiseniibacteriota bacterium]
MRASIGETVAVLQQLSAEVAPTLEVVARVVSGRIAAGGKILVCGNGGSAADSQHVATELTVRYLADRRPIPALALTVDSSVLTAAGNDLGFEQIFARQVEALGRPGDVLLAISTSGNSANVVRAAERARALGLVTVGLTGASGGKLARVVDHCLRAPSAATPRIQEAHLVMEHLLCEALEQAVVGGVA